jgi:Gram-negative bacterial TonB protein C-terminal
MSRLISSFAVFVTLISVGSRVVAQTTSQNKNKPEVCDGPVYKGNEVTKKAKISRLVNPYIPVDALKEVTGLVQIRAVLCVTGKVTNIEVIKGLPYGVTESVIKALLKTKFKPAEKDGQPVSQYFTREVRLDGLRN